MSNLKDVVSDNFARYAGNVILDRAICDVRDMLKPSARMLMYSQMHITKNIPSKPFVKSARVVGDCLGHYYTHGDSSCYSTYMRMAKPFAMRYPLEDCQGNSGTITQTGDEAASRYCVTGNTLVLSDKGFEYIGDITHSQENTDNDIDYPEIKGFFDNSGSSCLLNSGLQDVIEIRTKYGYNIKITPNHPLLTIDEEFNPVWVLAKDLKINDKVLIDLNPNFTWGGYENLTESAMLGIWVAEGSISTQNRVNFINQDLEYLKPAEDWLKSQGWQGNIKARKSDQCYELTSGKQDIYDYFINLDCGIDSYSKHIPNKILKSSKNNISMFLSYLFEGDGTISNNRITYSSVSKRLINELQNILAMGYGINSTISYSKTRNEIKLSIGGKINLVRFQQYINFVSTRKREKLQQSVQLNVGGGNNPRNFPIINNFIKKHYYGKGLLKTGGNKCYISNYDGLSRLKSIFSQEDYLKIENFYLYYMPVSIEEIKTGQQEVVYSFRINSNTHDYTGNSFINHNTELRLSKVGNELFTDIDKETISNWCDNFDETESYPSVLPSKGFYNIVNGSVGIGVSLSASVPQFNLREINDAMIHLIDDENYEVDILPDFATGGILINPQEVRESLKTGSGFACRLRSVVEFDQSMRAFIVKELPYGLYTNTLSEEIQQLVEKQPDCGIDHINDGSGKTPDYLIYLTKHANPDKVLRLLYKETSLESFFTINMNVLVDNGRRPATLGLKEMLQAHINHEREVYINGYNFDLKKIKARLHIIDGLLKAIDMIDEVIKTIKGSSDTKTAAIALQKLLSIDDVQAKAILDIKLSRLAHLEITKLEQEKTDLLADERRIENILSHDELLKDEIKKGLRAVADKFGDSRRTQILNLSNNDNSEPIEVKSLQMSLTNHNNLFVTEVSTLYTQRRGGVGNKFKLDNGEYVTSTITVQSNEEILFFTQVGNVYHIAAANVSMDEKVFVPAIVPMKEFETVAAITSAEKQNNAQYIMFFTRNGTVKKSELSEYNITRNAGLKALTLDEGDEIVGVLFGKDCRVGILTETGNFLMIKTDDIRPIGRIAKGVRAIKLNDGDNVTAARIIPTDTKYIASISGDGLFKQTEISEFTLQGRGTKGSKLQKLNEGDWMVDFLPIVSNNDVLITSTRSCIKLTTNDIPIVGKGALGNKSIKLAANDNVVGMCVN